MILKLYINWVDYNNKLKLPCCQRIFPATTIRTEHIIFYQSRKFFGERQKKNWQNLSQIKALLMKGYVLKKYIFMRFTVLIEIHSYEIHFLLSPASPPLAENVFYRSPWPNVVLIKDLSFIYSKTLWAKGRHTKNKWYL